MDLRFQDHLILIYFNSVKRDYILSDLKNIIGYTFGQLEDRIDELLESKYLFEDSEGTIKIATNGYEVLRSMGYEDINVKDIYEKQIEYKDKYSNPINFDEIYVPIGFDKKFSGYSTNS